MGKGLRPDILINTIEALSIEYLEKQGIKGMIVDLDNTILPWRGKDIPDGIKQWFAEQHSGGMKFCIVSNNMSKRVFRLAHELGVPAISRAVKPRRKAFRRALLILGTKPTETAVIGDQIFTDVLGGNRMGLHTILVSPLETKEFIWTLLARKMEKFILRHLK